MRLTVNDKAIFKLMITSCPISGTLMLCVVPIGMLAAEALPGVALPRQCRMVYNDRPKVLATVKHFLSPVAVTIEMTMASAVRPRCPHISATAQEHDVAVGGR
ncbi:hypothetical protein [Paraburkholderia sp. BCC1884]|uniref:hypothetical protein n=1 Tax=Paraburkholderia sp. BCC1884 TaxID=2562668 RepID=UPI0011827C70|nr:hypothetical protein [Paraburkholderia sp. BCC1884]